MASGGGGGIGIFLLFLALTGYFGTRSSSLPQVRKTRAYTEEEKLYFQEGQQRVCDDLYWPQNTCIDVEDPANNCTVEACIEQRRQILDLLASDESHMYQICTSVHRGCTQDEGAISIVDFSLERPQVCTDAIACTGHMEFYPKCECGGKELYDPVYTATQCHAEDDIVDLQRDPLNCNYRYNQCPGDMVCFRGDCGYVDADSNTFLNFLYNSTRCGTNCTGTAAVPYE